MANLANIWRMHFGLNIISIRCWVCVSLSLGGYWHSMNLMFRWYKKMCRFSRHAGILIMSIGLFPTINAFFDHTNMMVSPSRNLVTTGKFSSWIVLAVIQILLEFICLETHHGWISDRYGIIWLVLILLLLIGHCWREELNQSPPTTKPQAKIEIFRRTSYNVINTPVSLFHTFNVWGGAGSREAHRADEDWRWRSAGTTWIVAIIDIP